MAVEWQIAQAASFERPEHRESVPFSPQVDVPMEQDSEIDNVIEQIFEAEQVPVKSAQSLGETTLTAR